MLQSMSHRSICERKGAAFPREVLNCLREVLAWTELLKLTM